MAESLKLWAQSAVPLWRERFSDPEGGFFERLDRHGKPETMPKRLVTQCRQIYTYALAGYDVGGAYDDMVKHYRVAETGGSRFSLSDDTYDLYGLSFILLACAASGKPGYAHETLNFIDKNFRAAGHEGFVSRLDAKFNVLPGPLAQNPHMHLLEGCLEMMETARDPLFETIAGEIVDLFFKIFFRDGTLGEFFDAKGRPDPEKGHIVEAGHHAEWVWLLKRYRLLTHSDDPRLDEAMTSLFDWVRHHGRDPVHGGIFNAQTRDYSVIDEKKRIWPVTETLRAARVMKDMALADEMTRLLEGYYLKPDGVWTEVLNRDLTLATDYCPGTTIYHLYPVLKA